jgi:predicted secreted hydrolase
VISDPLPSLRTAIDAPSVHRRRFLHGLAALPWAAGAADSSALVPSGKSGIHPSPLLFPADHGAHPDSRIEWWYVTGTVLMGASGSEGSSASADRFGFQVTFFRSRTDVAADQPSRFAAKQLLFAHAALTDLKRGLLKHDQRIARSGFGIAEADIGDTALTLRDWTLVRKAQRMDNGSRYRARVNSDSAAFAFDFNFDTTQALLLQGDAGYSRKGPNPEQASHYYSQPQLAVEGTLTRDGVTRPVRGTAWLDHEWSDSLLDPDAVGWDWIGMNLADGSALTAFRLRSADGRAVYAGGSFRAAGGAVRSFTSDEVRFVPGRIWISPVSRARYPVEWTIATPVGHFAVRSLLDAQELDSRASTGSIYWEGLSELRDDSGHRVGHGYLEMTGYAARLSL